MTTRILRVGNTLTVEVPEELLAKTGFSAGEAVEWVVAEGGGLSLVPSAQPVSNAIVDPKYMREIPAGDDEAAILAGIRAGQTDFEAGRFVSNDRVMAWLDSWGTENELPMPECK